eukprot:5079176-Alexandrium_andersonii.AAC.1
MGRTSCWALACQYPTILRIVAWSLRRSGCRDFGPPRSPLSSADSESAKTTTQNAPAPSFRVHF